MVIASTLVAAPASAANAAEPVTPTIEISSNAWTEAEVRRSFELEWSRTATTEPTGSVETCEPGQASASSVAAQLGRLNWFRQLAGIDVLVGSPRVNDWADAQAAALIIAASETTDHTPPATAPCFSDAGRAGSAAANLHTLTGLAAVNQYLYEPGARNRTVGHRRWLLNPDLASVAIGELPGGHAIVVTRDVSPPSGSTPVLWPPSGAVPDSIVPRRWSLSLAGADFSAASVTVTRNGAVVGLVDRVADQAAQPTPTLMFELPHLPRQFPGSDRFEVTVTGVVVDGEPRNYRWTTNAFDPSAAPASQEAATTAWVTDVYRAVVGRAPSTVEIDRWQAIGPEASVHALVGSEERTGVVVDGLYHTMLGRGPDSGGRAYWIAQIRAGRPLTDVVVSFFDSPEYRSLAGASPSRWVEAVYQGVLGRPFDAAGRRYWVDGYTSGRWSAAQIVRHFYLAEESQSIRATATHHRLFGRAPSATQLSSWRADGLDGDRLLTSLLLSDAYRLRQG